MRPWLHGMVPAVFLVAALFLLSASAVVFGYPVLGLSGFAIGFTLYAMYHSTDTLRSLDHLVTTPPARCHHPVLEPVYVTDNPAGNPELVAYVCGLCFEPVSLTSQVARVHEKAQLDRAVARARRLKGAPAQVLLPAERSYTSPAAAQAAETYCDNCNVSINQLEGDDRVVGVYVTVDKRCGRCEMLYSMERLNDQVCFSAQVPPLKLRARP